MSKINWKKLAVSLAISLGTGGLSALVSAGSMKKYETMYQPPLSPPGWLFPIVWAILFILMGIAAYLVSMQEGMSEEKKTALTFYAWQLIVNAVWPVLFFNLEAFTLSFAWLVLLWYLIYKTLRSFSEVNQTAGKLLIPYLLWVTFAGYLNLTIAINS